MLRLTRRYQVSISHRLQSDQLSNEENVRLFGKCNNPFGHGHNYAVEISVAAEAPAKSGMLIPRAALDDLVHRAVLAKLDHANLNTDVAELRNLVPTTENLALLIRGWLRDAWEKEMRGQAARLDRVRVAETARNSFEVTN